MPLRQQPQEQAEIEIKDMLLRIAKLYQIPNLDAEGAVLLAEWILDEYKFTSFELIKRSLTNPPRTKEKSWRLTPETIGEWIEITRERMISETQQKESEERLSLPIEEANISEQTAKELNDLKLNLMEQMNPKKVADIHQVQPVRPKEKSYAVGYPHTPESEILKRELHIQWIRENIDPITKNKLEEYLDEREWLLNKGFYLENGQIKTI